MKLVNHLAVSKMIEKWQVDVLNTRNLILVLNVIKKKSSLKVLSQRKNHPANYRGLKNERQQTIPVC